jgi:hypothetical protein
MSSNRVLKRLMWFMAFGMILSLRSAPTAAVAAGIHLEVVRIATGRVLWEHPIHEGDRFTIDYRHSSDHTPVHDIFQVSGEGKIVLIEEDYQWYGAGLEFNSAAAEISLADKETRVRLHRVFPQLRLRVGEVANHVLTVDHERVPLLSIAEGRESLWIRTTHEAPRSR